MVVPQSLTMPTYFSGRHVRTGEPRPFKCYYRLPISGDAAVKFIDGEKSSLASEIAPIAVAEILALVSTQNEMFGLVNRKGEWLVKPDYNRLAYGD